jgi:hypothetical protein
VLRRAENETNLLTDFRNESGVFVECGGSKSEFKYHEFESINKTALRHEPGNGSDAKTSLSHKISCKCIFKPYISLLFVFEFLEIDVQNFSIF